MNEKIKNLLIEIQKPISDDGVDHLKLMEELYWKFSEGKRFLQPLMNYYLDGLDNLPILAVKDKWKEDRFVEIRKPFSDNFNKIKDVAKKILKQEEG